jgi:hypothetical protein
LGLSLDGLKALGLQINGELRVFFSKGQIIFLNKGIGQNLLYKTKEITIC